MSVALMLVLVELLAETISLAVGALNIISSGVVRGRRSVEWASTPELSEPVGVGNR